MTIFCEMVFEELVVGAIFDAQCVRDVFDAFKCNAFFAVHVHDGMVGGFEGIYAKRGEPLCAKRLHHCGDGLRAELFGKAGEEGLWKGASHKYRDIVH